MSEVKIETQVGPCNLEWKFVGGPEKTEGKGLSDLGGNLPHIVDGTRMTFSKGDVKPGKTHAPK